MNFDKWLQSMDSLPIEDFFKRKDPLASSRKEYKFIIPHEKLPQVLEFLAQDFVYTTCGGKAFHHYQTHYFDTPEKLFFKRHRQGKFNRIKVRIREYQTGEVERFVECKKKIKGIHTEKHRQKFQDQLDARFIQEHLEPYGAHVQHLQQQLTLDYKRLFLLSKDFRRRVTIDSNIEATNLDGETKELLSQYVILEVKEKGLAKDIHQYLRREHGIRPQSFSKYCVGLALMNPQLKANRWKPVFKKYVKHERV